MGLLRVMNDSIVLYMVSVQVAKSMDALTGVESPEVFVDLPEGEPLVYVGDDNCPVVQGLCCHMSEKGKREIREANRLVARIDDRL